MPAVIINCDCQSEFQDKLYGKNRRVANVKDAKPHECTCTVCGKIRNVKEKQSEAAISAKGKK